MHPALWVRAIATGILCGVTLASWVGVSSLALFSTLALAGVLLLLPYPWVRIVACVVLGCVVGVWRMEQVVSMPHLALDLAQAKSEVSLVGVVDGSWEDGKWPFRVLQVHTQDQVIESSDRVLVSSGQYTRPRFGQELVLSGKLTEPKPFDDFDYPAYLRMKGVSALMYMPRYDVPEQSLTSPAQRAYWRVRFVIDDVRIRLHEILESSLRPLESAYAQGILLGDDSAMSDAVVKAFRTTGTSHILAVSGYNITIVIGVLAIITRRFGRLWSFVATCGAVVLFVALVGESASVVRAGLMGILVLVSMMSGRLSSTFAVMVLTATVMALHNPLIVRWDVGFQLSFAALAGLVFIEPILRSALPERKGWLGVLMSIALATTSAQIAVLPLLLYQFGALPVYSLIVNVIVLPLVPLAMALASATAVAGLLWPLAGMVAGQVAHLVLGFQLWVIEWFARLPHASLEAPLSAYQAVLVYVALLAWVGISYYGSRRLPAPCLRMQEAGTVSTDILSSFHA